MIIKSLFLLLFILNPIWLMAQEREGYANLFDEKTLDNWGYFLVEPDQFHQRFSLILG